MLTEVSSSFEIYVYGFQFLNGVEYLILSMPGWDTKNNSCSLSIILNSVNDII